jgi:CheY-like chemotaxis protein/DNA-directed RNA polymerase specialized sigma24 family protein
VVETENRPDLGEIVGTYLPYLRRFSRALTGNQESGDHYAAVTLEAIISDRSVFDEVLSPKTALFKAFNSIWSTSGARVEDPDTGMSQMEKKAQKRLASLTPNAREALLLSALEGFPTSDIGQIMGVSTGEAAELVRIGTEEIAAETKGRVLIIEDEPIIALDIKHIVTELGHEVVGIARTASAAVAKATETNPDLVLADIQLADGSSGIDAVHEILSQQADKPVIFITAYPERLLTGQRPEPTFLITKPFSDEQVQAAVGQALFFGSTAFA